MKLKKRSIVLLIVLLLIPTVMAESGCFTHKESSLYCKTISRAEAQEECFLLEDCLLTYVFSPLKICADSIAECKQVLCKSSCTTKVAGKCREGIVPSGEESDWCSAGCCLFEYAGKEVCTSMQNKWLCEVEAQNREALDYSFSSGVSELGCTAICSKSKAQKELLSLPVEEITPKKPVVKTPPEEEKPAEVTTEGSSSLILVWLVILIIGAIVVYYLFKKKIIDFSALFSRAPPTEDLTGKEREKYLSKVLSPFTFNPLSKAKLNKLKAKRKHKVKEQLRQNYFLEHDLIPVKVTQKEFHQLKDLIRKYEHKQKYTPTKISPKEKKIFAHLEDLIEVMERKQKTVLKTEEKRKFVEIQRKEATEIVEKLRKIAFKK